MNFMLLSEFKSIIDQKKKQEHIGVKILIKIFLKKEIKMLGV